MSFISFFKKTQEADDKARADKERELLNLNRTIEDTKAAMQRAAEAGDAKEYMRLKGVLETYEADKVVKQAVSIKIQHNKGALLTEWNKYAVEYNESFKKAYSEYEKAKAETLKQLRKLAIMQSEAAKESECAGALDPNAEQITRIDVNEINGLEYLKADINEVEGIRYIIKSFRPLNKLDDMRPGWMDEKTPEQISELQKRKEKQRIEDVKRSNRNLADFLKSFSVTLDQAVNSGYITPQRAEVYEKIGI